MTRPSPVWLKEKGSDLAVTHSDASHSSDHCLTLLSFQSLILYAKSPEVLLFRRRKTNSSYWVKENLISHWLSGSKSMRDQSKRPLLDFAKLSISGSSSRASRKVLVRHVETVTSSEVTVDIVKSLCWPQRILQKSKRNLR
ncbi:hypothetical protein HAX54_045382 [Datura stramonium]|uniref:Uncharacterized protein n=1 Tax=Datura stramonium TaxID=4076 RepID=A0ABS8WJM4_DATST|nr:hypothetical protein [Datura stramonium]